MATNFIAPGTTVDYANAGAAIVSGQVVLIGTRVGIAKDAIPATTGTGVLHVDGVWQVTKLATDVVTQGQALYWDNGNSRFTTTVGSNVLAGWAYAAAAGGANTVVQIKLLG